MRDLRKTVRGALQHHRVAQVRSHLPELNFITLHYTYFIGVCLVTSGIFYAASKPDHSITYTDSLFLVVSAMTEAGLNTVNLSMMTTFQQIILWLLIILGSAIWVSIFTVLARKRFFEIRFEDIVKRQKQARKLHRRSMSANRGRPMPYDMKAHGREGNEASATVMTKEQQYAAEPSTSRDPPQSSASMAQTATETNEDKSVVLEKSRTHPEVPGPAPYHSSVPHTSSSGHSGAPPARTLNFAVEAHPNSTSMATRPSEGLINRGRARTEERNDDQGAVLHDWHYPHYLTRQTTGRNAQFFDLTRSEREHLGGVEYRAISLLAYVVPIYFVLWQLLGCLGLGAYIAHNKPNIAYENGINPWWLGVFNGASAFNNSGMSLLDANMIPFQDSAYVIITMGLLILAGNTAYPLFLRLILWSMLKLLCFLYPSPNAYSDHKATLRFVLRYPRRVYTNLFPSVPTWWLLFMLIVLNGVDWAAFEVLNIHNAAVNSIPTNFRILDGLFQALAVRSGGFYIIAITSLRIGLQVLYIIMMYISVYPVVITMRHSNVYEERSLGIYAEDNPASDVEEGLKQDSAATKVRRTITHHLSMSFQPVPTSVHKHPAAEQFVRQQIRGQLAYDLWWLVLAIFLISIIEVSNFERDPVTYSVFNIAFEVVSGYGCVGISTGLPNDAYSFSGGWHKLSKLILCAVMLRGRHRGLPVALDRAVRLPGAGGKELGKTEEEDRVLRSRSRSLHLQRRDD